MSPYQISDNTAFTESSVSRIDTAIEWLLVGLLTFMPFAFGVVHAWSKEIVIILSGGIVLCFLGKLVYHRELGIIWTPAYIPVAAFLLVAALQLLPLPAILVRAVSPNTFAIKTELLSDLPGADRTLKSMPLSFYSNATQNELWLVLSITAVFIVVFNVMRHPKQIKRLLMSIALVGGVVALVTLAQNLFGNGKIYWFVPTKHGNGYCGPFVNHNNYGQFMNLSIGAAIAYLCVKLHEDFAHKRISPDNVFNQFASGSAKIFWLLIAITSLGIATVFITLTRSGMVSMLIALSFTTLSLTWRRSLKSHGWIMVVLALVAFTCILYTGFDAVYDRIATLRSFNEAEGGRLQILKDILIMCTKFPIFGTGLGTHPVIYPMFDRSTIAALAAHAENEYAQVLEETGVVGLSLMVIFGFIIWVNYAKSIRNINLPVCSAAYGLGFGLLAILIQSLSDFGQHLPANSSLSAIFCALLLTLGQQQRVQKHIRPAVSPAEKFKWLPLTIFLIAAAFWVWAFIDSNNARIAEAHWKKAVRVEKSLAGKNWLGTETEYLDLLSYATVAIQYEPQNIQYQYWYNVYRWHWVTQKTDPDTGQIVIAENAMPVVRDIVKQLHKVCLLCPTYGQAYSVVGQVEKFILNDDNGAENIRKGFRLAPCDPMACFAAGYLDVLEGRTDECLIKFERAVQLDSNLFEDVANLYIYHLNQPHLAIQAAGDDITRLSYVTNALLDMQYNDLATQTLEKMKNLLEAQCSAAQAPVSAFETLARIYARQHNNAAAIECYRRALGIDYSQVYWRLDLAKLLVEARQIPEAVRETKICLRLRPGLKAAEELLEQLSVDSAAFGKEIKSP